MGLECAKPAETSFSRHEASGEKTFESQMSKIKEITTFQIKINNLRLLNPTKPFQNIKIELKHAFSIVVHSKDLHLRDNVLVSQQTFTAEFKTSIKDLTDKYVYVFLEEKGGKSTEVLKIKVNQLFRGPMKHDHLLKQYKSRLLFDFHIDQYLHSDILLEHCEIQWSNPLHHADYTYFLSLIFSNSRSPIQTCKVFEKREKIKEMALNKMFLKSSELRDAIIRIKIIDNLTGENVFEHFLPFSKLQQQHGFKTIIIQDITYELREILIDQSISLVDESIGAVKLQLKFFMSKLYAQQMECVILSEDGIVMHTLSEHQIKVNSSTHKEELKLQLIMDYVRRLESIKEFGVSQYDLYILLENIYIKIQDKHFEITDELFKTQENLLNFLLILAQLLELDKELQNEYIWGIINHLCREPILKLKYFCGIKNDHERIIFAKKFYRFLILVLIKIINLTENGISFKELINIHKFIAFTYFRLPWCQEEIVKILQKEGDPLISEEKLAQIGASYALKSPSKNYFYDWEGSVLRLVRKDQDFVNWIKELNEAKRINGSWAKLLFDREYEQLFYSIYSQLWDQAESFLNNNGKILWQYFPRYGELLSIFFGEINNSKIMDFSPQMTKCNMKLIKNQKLLTTFMMLIFPKTHLYETFCVIKCLNLIECYFNVILNNHKKLPYNFNYNYFYTGIKCILQSQNSYLLQKMLSIIYKFYFIFTKQFKEVLNNFIISKVFYKLFLHWSQDVRNIFHLLLIFRIYERQNSENPEVSLKKSKNMSQSIQIKLQYEHIIQSLLTRLQISNAKQIPKIQTTVSNEFFQKMKAKLNKREKQKDMQNLLVFHTESEEISETLAMRKCSYFDNSPVISRRKWSVTQDWESQGIIPTEKELKYLEISLRQFEQAKKQLKPCQKVQLRSKMFQEVDE